MNFKSFQKLEFHKVLDRLAARCGSAMGKRAVGELEVFDTEEDVAEALALTTEARTFVDTSGSPWDFGSLKDISDGMRKLEASRVLEPEELDAFRALLEFSASVKGSKLDTEKFPSIAELREDLFAGTAITRRIAACIDGANGTVKDSASPQLAKTRKKLRELERAIPEQLRKMMFDSSMDSKVQDRVVTMRNGRFVIPVRSEQATGDRWVLQDRSSSGATSFVEPLDLVQENNRLTRERLMEKSEVLKILRELSSLLSDHYDEILANVESLGALDCLIARGRLSRETSSVAPEISSNSYIRILGGRHPLLGGDVVPVDVTMGGDVRALVLTGPNAGGKTVALKMIGLFQFMAQCGLHVPAKSGTQLPVFSDVYAVIGDEQSIEANLSTFSSHLSEIKSILDDAGDHSLVLIDEICSGTDPEEGSALACGIIQELMSRGAVCLATSHHNGLKTFASVTSGAENASVLFDERTKTPVYRVEVGIPGKSYALEIARRVGITESLLDSAQEYLSSQARMTERLLAELEEMKSFISIEQQKIDGERKEIQSKKAETEKKLDEAREKHDKVLREALDEAQKIVDQTREKCREILRGAGSAKSLPQAAAVKGSVKKEKKKLQKKKKTVAPRIEKVDPKKLKPDMSLLLADTRETVSFVSGPDRKGKVKVLLGDFTLSTHVDNLAVYAGPEEKKKPPKRDYTRFVADARMAVKSEIDLHGMRVLEALETLDRELETLNLAGASQVRIVHGIGTGALMKAVQEYLEKSPFVHRHEICSLREGGIGATMAYLK